MIFGRRKRFADLVARQLDLFEREHAALIEEAGAAEAAYDRARREDAEERYANYMDAVESCTEILAEIRDSYGSTLDEDALLEYEDTFNRAVARRYPRFALEL